MPHELMIPADALARINMLFRKQQKAAGLSSATKTKESVGRTDVARNANSQSEPTNGPAPEQG